MAYRTMEPVPVTGEPEKPMGAIELFVTAQTTWLASGMRGAARMMVGTETAKELSREITAAAVPGFGPGANREWPSAWREANKARLLGGYLGVFLGMEVYLDSSTAHRMEVVPAHAGQ